jgi:hypothetical protein
LSVAIQLIYFNIIPIYTDIEGSRECPVLVMICLVSVVTVLVIVVSPVMKWSERKHYVLQSGIEPLKANATVSRQRCKWSWRWRNEGKACLTILQLDFKSGFAWDRTHSAQANNATRGRSARSEYIRVVAYRKELILALYSTFAWSYPHASCAKGPHRRRFDHYFTLQLVQSAWCSADSFLMQRLPLSYRISNEDRHTLPTLSQSHWSQVILSLISAPYAVAGAMAISGWGVFLIILLIVLLLGGGGYVLCVALHHHYLTGTDSL